MLDTSMKDLFSSSLLKKYDSALENGPEGVVLYVRCICMDMSHESMVNWMLNGSSMRSVLTIFFCSPRNRNGGEKECRLSSRRNLDHPSNPSGITVGGPTWAQQQQLLPLRSLGFLAVALRPPRCQLWTPRRNPHRPSPAVNPPTRPAHCACAHCHWTPPPFVPWTRPTHCPAPKLTESFPIGATNRSLTRSLLYPLPRQGRAHSRWPHVSARLDARVRSERGGSPRERPPPPVLPPLASHLIPPPSRSSSVGERQAGAQGRPGQGIRFTSSSSFSTPPIPPPRAARSGGEGSPLPASV